jgi:selenocysteine lyase/cysteine desulfurase
MIYLDNAATSWPKPDAVCNAMAACIKNYGANPGRSGHRMAIQAGEKVYECRENLARLFGIGDPLRIAFTANATEAINLAVKGLLAAGDHVIITSMEHNAVVRPLKKLERQGVELSVVKADSSGRVGLAGIENNVRQSAAWPKSIKSSLWWMRRKPPENVP